MNLEENDIIPANKLNWRVRGKDLSFALKLFVSPLPYVVYAGIYLKKIHIRIKKKKNRAKTQST